LRILLPFLLFLIWEQSTSPGMTHWQRVEPALGLPLFFSGYCLLILIARLLGSRVARGLVLGDLGRAVDRFNLGMSCARAFIPLWFAVGVFVLGWKPAVDKILGPIADWPVFTPSTILGLLPGFIAWMGLWWSQFPPDRALREQNVLYQLESDLPVFAPPNFRGYFLNKLRVQLLFTVVPMVMIMILRDLAIVAMAIASRTSFGQRWGLDYPLSDSAEQALIIGSVLVVLLLSPELLRHVLQTQRLPESHLRQSLSALCQQTGIRCREILLWRTQNNMGNAAVMGLFPRIRYVMLSDLLLESMTDQQIQAVFAHELGHVKHRHLVWLLLFFLTVGGCLYGLASALENHLPLLTDNWREAFEAASTLACGGLLLVGFGFLSRWFERQADVYAARMLEKPIGDQINPAQAEGFGAELFASALERVALVNNIPISARNWTHGSIQSRMRYIHRLGRDPKVAERFDRTGRRVLAILICLIGICAVMTVWTLR
jgi:STE24 endopeptidase